MEKRDSDLQGFPYLECLVQKGEQPGVQSFILSCFKIKVNS